MAEFRCGVLQVQAFLELLLAWLMFSLPYEQELTSYKESFSGVMNGSLCLTAADTRCRPRDVGAVEGSLK